MAGIFERIGDILSSNINALLDKAEDPGKMVDQYLRKAKEDLTDVRKNTAAVMAEEKRCKRLVDEAKQEVKELTAYAEKAVLAGNDGDATIFLTKKQAAAGRLADAKQTYATAKGHADQMRQAHDKLVSDISALEARKANIKATAAVAKTQERRIIPPDFFVKKDWRTHGCDSREEASFLNGEKPPGFVLFAESRGAGRFRIETDAGSVRPAKKESPCRRSSRDFFVGLSAATCP